MLQSTIISMAYDLATVSSAQVTLGVVTSWTTLCFAALVMLGIGVGLGYLLSCLQADRAKQSSNAKHVDASAEQPITDTERAKMLELLHDIGSWTNEYNHKVSQYQNELGKLNQTVNQSEPGNSISVTSDRIVNLLQQFMQNSGQLQQRLDAAEFQLDQKLSLIHI